MAVKAVSVADALSEIGIKVLIYGPTGSGKTTIARTMPKPVLVLDFEGGILSLLNEGGIAVCPIRSTEDLLQAVSELQKDSTFLSVVFDGLSIFVKRRVQELRGTKERVTWDEWQKLTNEVRAAVLPLLQLKKHLLLTCLPRWIRQKDERGRDIGPIIGATIDLTPALRQDLIAACDLVGYLVGPNDPLFQNASERRVLFKPDSSFQIVCKTRAEVFGQEEPNFSKWLIALQLPLEGEKLTANFTFEVFAKAEQPVEQLTGQSTESAEQHHQESTQSAEQAQSTAQLQSTGQPQSAEHSQSRERSAEAETDEVTRRIFQIARELGMDNKALGRIAKNYFGTSFVKNLGQDQKQRLLAFLERRLAERKPTEQKGEAVQEFIHAWRQARSDSSEFPFEAELAEIAVRNSWLPDELEAAISEKLLERSFDFSTLPQDQYWLSAVPKELLTEVVSSLRKKQ